ncbi:MAG TPA: hypothetical protein VJ732_01475 [Bryobacteraceae bacterium]|nr:hypothetical protein [Bryobacteraceae bacterium]
MNQQLRALLAWIGVPLCIVLAITGLGAFWPDLYVREKPVSAAGGVASDLIDLFLVVPVLVVSTILARRGSLGALLIWTGTLGFLSYNFLIYTFAVRFNAMFPAYCAVLGLSFYGLMAVREFLSPGDAARAWSPGAPRRSMALVFLVVAVTAAAGELKEIVSAIHSGQAPPSVIETGQFTNPIHVLDLCFLLPALVIAAVLLLRRKEKGFVLAPVLSVVLILISLEVTTIVLLLVRQGLAADFSPALSFVAVGVLVTVLLAWYFRPRRHRVRESPRLASGL